MKDSNPYRFETRVIHAGQHPRDWQGASLAPIYQSASHRHTTAADLSRAFAGEQPDPIYMRLGNPTNRVLEQRLADLEGGQKAVVMSSGMAAVSNACMALLRAGDELVAGSSLFLSTYILFTQILPKYGITARFADPKQPDGFEALIGPKTRFVYVEAIGNPQMDVPELDRLSQLAHHHQMPLVVDATLATPYLCRPLAQGADLVIHSTTKYLSGHGAALGGAVIDAGQFDWSPERFPDFQSFVDRKGPLALLDKIWREQHINFGTTQAPMHAFLTLLGLDTLAVRMQRHMENAATVAAFLDRHPKVKWVNYPGLAAHPCHETARRQFGGRGFGGLLTFGLEDQEACFRFIDGMQLIYHLANLGDCKTLAIHPYSSQYVNFDIDTRKALGIAPGMIRLSVGIEAAADICDDLDQALRGI